MRVNKGSMLDDKGEGIWDFKVDRDMGRISIPGIADYVLEDEKYFLYNADGTPGQILKVHPEVYLFFRDIGEIAADKGLHPDAVRVLTLLLFQNARYRTHSENIGYGAADYNRDTMTGHLYSEEM
jgi:hypothetical protein